MHTTFTQNDLLTLIYGECDNCTAINIKQELTTNTELANEYRELKQSIALLEQHLQAPKEATVSKLLQYSKENSKKLLEI